MNGRERDKARRAARKAERKRNGNDPTTPAPIPASQVPLEAPFEEEAERIDTAELLDEIKEFVSRFVVLPSDEAADLIALWALHTHALDAAWCTPYLRIVSAAPNSGKTLLMEILAVICLRGWHTVDPSTAVLYRKVDREQPTLLLDEMDNYPLDERRGALGILNTGYKKGQTITRCRENGDLEDFECFCPKAFAGIDGRALVDTLLSRTITIRMERKTSSEKVDMWIAPLVEPDAISLRVRCVTWARQHVEGLSNHPHPNLCGMINRRAEAWWALLVIGEYAGNGWEERARAAARALSTGGDEADETPSQVQLLLDISAAFGDDLTISSNDLLAKLNGLEESSWGTRRRGEGLDARGLAKMLRPFKIKPRTVRVYESSSTAKGYHVNQFDDAFSRYLPEGSHRSHGSHLSADAGRDVTDVTDVTDFEEPSEGELAEADRVLEKHSDWDPS